jgi:hypothetical protein
MADAGAAPPPAAPVDPAAAAQADGAAAAPADPPRKKSRWGSKEEEAPAKKSRWGSKDDAAAPTGGGMAVMQLNPEQVKVQQRLNEIQVCSPHCIRAPRNVPVTH